MIEMWGWIGRGKDRLFTGLEPPRVEIRLRDAFFSTLLKFDFPD
jgi:hypothetical protein